MADIIGMVLEGILPFVNLILSILLIVELAKAIFNIGNPNANKDTPGVVSKAVSGFEDMIAKDTKKLLTDNEESVAAHKAHEDAKKAEAAKLAEAEKKGGDAEVPPQLVSLEELAAKADIKEFTDSQKTLDEVKRIYGVLFERAQTIQGKFMQTNNQQGLTIIRDIHSAFLDMEAKIKSYQQVQGELGIAMQKKRDLEAKGRTFRTKSGSIAKAFIKQEKANNLEHTQASKIVDTLEQAIVGLQRDISAKVMIIGTALEQGAKIAGTPGTTQAIK